MPTTPFMALLGRIGQLNRDITAVLNLELSGQVGEETYAGLYNRFLQEAEQLAGKESGLPKAPEVSESVSEVGVLVALKALTSQLKMWLDLNPPGS